MMPWPILRRPCGRSLSLLKRSWTGTAGRLTGRFKATSAGAGRRLVAYYTQSDLSPEDERLAQYYRAQAGQEHGEWLGLSPGLARIYHLDTSRPTDRPRDSEHAGGFGRRWPSSGGQAEAVADARFG